MIRYDTVGIKRDKGLVEARMLSKWPEIRVSWPWLNYREKSEIPRSGIGEPGQRDWMRFGKMLSLRVSKSEILPGHQ
jgi:hypothetical protein